VKVYRAADRVPKPWKNGGGETSDVFVRPEGASFDRFTARVSIALVAQDGPFSAFAGIDRTLTVLTGEGLKLAVDGLSPVTLTPLSEPFAFSGDAPAYGALNGGPISDCNVMTRRGEAAHRVDVFRLGAGDTWTGAPGDTLLLWAEGEGEAETPEGTAQLGPLDALTCEAKGLWRIRADKASRLILVRWLV